MGSRHELADEPTIGEFVSRGTLERPFQEAKATTFNITFKGEGFFLNEGSFVHNGLYM